ncbi:MAG: vWA domain-containing protein [Desulfopila sp.]
MFIQFFYTLREAGIPASPTAFLRLHRAMASGLVASLDDLYIAARTILVKSERFFDLYDRVFAHHFAGIPLPAAEEEEFDLLVSGLLQQWLQNPKELAAALAVDSETLAAMSAKELLDYFRKRLRDQDGRHDGGSKWIGTGGTSPVGHSGWHPGGLRVGGGSRSRSALKVAGERRYREYGIDAPLTRQSMGEALKRLRHLVPQGAKDRLNVDKTISATVRNGGEIEMVFDRAIVDRLRIILAIDNGGWSMEPHVELVQTLFSYARAQFKDIRTYYFHNTIYDCLWSDPARRMSPVQLETLCRLDQETRLIIVGDASMAPYELMATDGSIYAFERSGRPSVARLRSLVESFPRTIWLNPVPRRHWPYTRTIATIGAIVPMFELSLDGLEQGVVHLMSR